MSVDEGAREALLRWGGSLLASGITEAEGHFSEGDVVAIQGEDGRVFARGICRYSKEEVLCIAGKRSSDAAGSIGREGSGEVVHRDDMVMI